MSFKISQCPLWQAMYVSNVMFIQYLVKLKEREKEGRKKRGNKEAGMRRRKGNEDKQVNTWS